MWKFWLYFHQEFWKSRNGLPAGPANGPESMGELEIVWNASGNFSDNLLQLYSFTCIREFEKLEKFREKLIFFAGLVVLWNNLREKCKMLSENIFGVKLIENQFRLTDCIFSFCEWHLRAVQNLVAAILIFSSPGLFFAQNLAEFVLDGSHAPERVGSADLFW
jgi:hypothetical protein